MLELRGVTKEFPYAGGTQRVLDGVDLAVEPSDSVAIVGPSGSGKSTLLNLIGALDRPTSGEVLFRGDRVDALGDEDLARYRNRSVGFVFQLHHLLPQCTAIENVLVPTLVNADAAGARERAERLLERVGLGDRMDARPGTLSGGERQRVAVVRALMNQPDLLLADEPTGSLDWEGARDLTQLMLELSAEENMALVVVTHALELAQSMDRVLALRAGKLAAHEESAAT
jgi:ABC-type lipoprotein export system ATPase subunit